MLIAVLAFYAFSISVKRKKETLKFKELLGKIESTKAEVIDTYDSSKKGQGAYKEQKAIDSRGGVDKLDNKRNERSPEKMKELDKKYGNGI